MESPLNRREFLKMLGMAGAGTFLVTSPWLSAFAQVDQTTKEKVRIGIIGPGSRGRFLMKFILKNPKVQIAALCDVYQPSIDEALKMVPNVKVYNDYKKLLEDKSIDAVVIATPLDRHYQMILDAFDAGKDVFCEKSICYDLWQCHDVYKRYKAGNKIFFVGQQRLFDSRYVKAMKMVHDGVFGEINAIWAYWNRNNDWRRPCPSDDLDEHINWRLYKKHSKGIMTELACHQLQVGTWAFREIPNTIMGHAAITRWKDRREVYDNLSCIYAFDSGVKMTYDSVLSNKFYGFEEKIMGTKGTIEPEMGKFYFEKIAPAPAFMRLVDEIEMKVFNAVPFAGTSWEPETASKNKGEYILGKAPKADGTSLMLDAFVESVITRKQPENIAEEAYYASALSLLGHQAVEEGKIITFPDEYKIDYLNHSAKIQ